MKFLGNKKLTLPLLVGSILITACFDPANNEQQPVEQQIRVKVDSTEVTAQLIPVEWGEFHKE